MHDHDEDVFRRTDAVEAYPQRRLVFEVEGLFEKPLHPYTQGLIDCIPVPGKTKPGEHLGSIPGIVPTLVGDLTGCTFRDRCGFAHDRCAGDVNENVLRAGRQFRCVLPAELADRNLAAAQ